jgi:hypothetical protein
MLVWPEKDKQECPSSWVHWKEKGPSRLKHSLDEPWFVLFVSLGFIFNSGRN